MAVVSIIIPTYNSESTILETLKSVSEQSMADFECIIVDDCSNDLTHSKVKNFITSDPRFSLERLSKNSGASACRNLGIEKSTSELLMFLDSDDLISSYCIKQRIAEIKPDYHFTVFPNYKRLIEGKTVDFKMTPKDYSKSLVLKKFITHNLPLPWNISSIIWKRCTLVELKGFDISYFRMQDVEIMTRALILDFNYEIHFLKPDFVYRATVSDHSIQNKRMKFYKSSQLYIRNMLDFTSTHSPSKLNLVRKFIRKFMFYVLGITIISKQFSPIDSKQLVQLGSKFELIHKRSIPVLKFITVNKWVRCFIRLPLIRSLFWRSLIMYLKKN